MTTPDPHYRRNFLLGVINGSLVNFGLAFVDPFTVLPVFVTRLGGSNVDIGIIASVFAAFWFLPQVFVGRVAQARTHVLPIYSWMALVRALGYAGAAASVFLIDIAHPEVIIAALVIFLSLSTLSAGIAGVPFLEVTSKMIPAERRGSFFGLRRFFGGLLGIVAGILIAVILGGKGSGLVESGPLFDVTRQLATSVGLTGHLFPHNYGVLFAIGGTLASVGMLLFVFIRERPAELIEAKPSMKETINAGLRLLRSHENYRMFFLVRVCWQLSAMSFPFYAAYAFTVVGFSEASVGVFVSIWVGSGVVSNYVWGVLADRRGNRVVLVMTAIISIAPPIIVLLFDITATPTGFTLLGVIFFLNGFARSGRFISNMTYLLEAVPLRGRPLYVGFMNSLSFPFMLSPIVGGIIVETSSFQILFIISAVFAILNVLLSLRLSEPRDLPPEAVVWTVYAP
jgi:MFS family permease